MIYKSIIDLVGSTPLLELNNLKNKLNLKSNIYAKLEGYNPIGSIKDRAALQMILDYEKENKLKVGSTIIEPTSGNTGIAISAIGALKGYKVIIIMPSNVSIERVKLIKHYGAEVVLTDPKLGMQGSIDKANELLKEIPSSIILGQFKNKSNPLAHYLNTAKEIYNDLNKINYFVSGIGTGGTISGVGRYLKEKNKDIKVIGVEPYESPLISKNKVSSHKIPGIGANFVPLILDREVIDEFMYSSYEEALKYSKLIAKLEGLSIGISSGAALKVALDLALKEENKNIVVIFPDFGSRYYSTELFNEE